VEAESAGLCVLLANSTNAGHGPALNQALEWVSRVRERIDRVWLLDSDWVIAVLQFSLGSSGARRLRARPSSENGNGIRGTQARFGLHSLIVDSAILHRADVLSFDDGGDPAFCFLRSAEEAGLRWRPFPSPQTAL
jgi:hypothetical protein